MSLIIKVAFLTICLLFTSCYSEINDVVTLEDYQGDILVIYGVVSPYGSEVSVSQSLPINAPYFESDFTLGGDVNVVLKSVQDSSIFFSFTYDEQKDKYYLTDTLRTDLQYIISANASGFSTTTSQPLSFSKPLESIRVDFDRSEEGTSTGVRVRTQFQEEAFHLIQPLSEDSIPSLNRSLPITYTNLDNIFLDQCGILNATRDLVLSDVCYPNDSMDISFTHEYSTFTNERFGSRIVSPPMRIGVSVGSISRADFNFLASLRRNQNVLDDYLVREPITLTNMTEGYGYVLAANGSKFWLDL